MPKSAGFKISQITGKRQPFVVDVPATYSPTGKRHRKSFSTQQDAKGYVSLLKEKRRRGIEQVTFLTPHVARQAAESNALLQPLGDTSLTDAVSVFLEAREELKSVGEVDIVAAVRHYADFKKQRSESVTFRSLMEQFEDAPTKKTRRQKAEKYRNQIRSLANRMNPLIGDHLVCDLDDKAVVAAIRKSKVNPASIAPSYRVLKAAFNFAVKRKWSGGNPVDSIDWFTHDPGDAEVPSLEQASALLECARGELRAYVAICLFAGCRDSEARRLDWRDFDWEKEEIDLKAAPGKKAASGRFIRLEPNLAKWLKPLCRHTGRVCGFTDGQLRTGMERLRRIADERLEKENLGEQATLKDGWQRDLLRHGAASYWAAIHGITKACAWLGHSEEIHRKHYRRPVSKGDAEAFFGIEPQEEALNVVPISA